ncbi:hypothetical protein ACLMJK_003907 [Lecanora helva]
MPLVVPGLAPHATNLQEEWSTKLVGKKITEGGASDEVSFAKRDLPEQSRVIAHGDVVTQDVDPNRMNIHLAEDGTVREVDFK